MFCCTLLYVHSSIAIILMGKRELIALLNLSSWCLMVVERLLLAVPRGCLRFVIVVFPDHTHLLFFSSEFEKIALQKNNNIQKPPSVHTKQFKIQHDKVSISGPQGKGTQIFYKTMKPCVSVDFIVED